MEDNCTITDAGAAELAQLKQLQTLRVGGFVSEAGVEALSNYPISQAANGGLFASASELQARSAKKPQSLSFVVMSTWPATNSGVLA